MKNEGKIIYAIFKNGEHKGNQFGFSKTDAIKEYLISCQFELFLNNKDFVSQYDAIIAKKDIHFQSSECVLIPKSNER